MKNKISKYDFLIVGGGLIGSLTALSLHKRKLKVLVIDDKSEIKSDQRTLAVNANSKEFLLQLGIWDDIKTKPQLIKKIIIKDYINSLPLIFKNDKEIMGNVIYNAELHKIILQKLKILKILKLNVKINIDSLKPNTPIEINSKNYSFKKIILSIGKKIISESKQKKIVFNNGDFSYVGFFQHKICHNSTAYEIFNKEGPLAVLPSPSLNSKKSTFIFSTNKNTSFVKIKALINKHFYLSHGQMSFDKELYKFPVIPHLTKFNKNFIFIGDTLKSIHPVAGQGWNLGVKDIQTLHKLIDQHKFEGEIFNYIYYSRRVVESFAYLGFTSLINMLYENQNNVNSKLIKLGYQGLQNISALRKLFIKQAMGKLNLID